MLTLDRTELLITHRCTLKCKLCGNYSPLYVPAPEWSFEQLADYLDLYFEVVDKVQKLTLSGGEPLMHPQLEILITYLQKYRNRIGLLELITNGTLVPKAVLLDAMQAFGNVKVIIDNYGPQLSTQVSQAESAFASHCIFYETRKYFGKDAYYSGWLDMTDLADKHRTPADDAAVYASCIFSQHFQRCIIADGRIYICAVGRRLNELGVLKTNHDYLDLTDDKLTIRDKQKILQSFFERDSFESCHYCNGFCMDRPRYVPAEQLEKPLANDTSENHDHE